MKDVKEWFENKDYDEGVKLYDEYGDSSFLKELFRSGETDFTRNKLTDELISLSAKVMKPNVSKSEPNTVEMINKTNYFPFIPQPIYQDIKPEKKKKESSFAYLKLCKRRDDLNRQISRNMVLLDESRSKNRRFEAAKQIISLDRKKREVWAEIDYFTEHGHLMPVAVKKEPKTDEIQRLYVQIWKAEKRLEKEDLRNREKTEKLLAEKRERLAKLKQERKMK